MNNLERCGIPYSLVIEPQEYDAYAAHVDPKKILVLPFSNLGQGSIPARNWVFWEHAIQRDATHHWIMDDNIKAFRRVLRGERDYIWNDVPLRVVEDFVDRYENLWMAGLQYTSFIINGRQGPLVFNTRVYSLILLDHRCPFRWRGRYNEDTDLS